MLGRLGATVVVAGLVGAACGGGGASSGTARSSTTQPKVKALISPNSEPGLTITTVDYSAQVNTVLISGTLDYRSFNASLARQCPQAPHPYTPVVKGALFDSTKTNITGNTHGGDNPGASWRLELDAQMGFTPTIASVGVYPGQKYGGCPSGMRP